MFGNLTHHSLALELAATRRQELARERRAASGASGFAFRLFRSHKVDAVAERQAAALVANPRDLAIVRCA